MEMPKGVFDILPYGVDERKKSKNWQYIEEMIKKACFDYCYREIRTPIFERTEVFQKAVGETSDIVTKEMYTFLDKGKRSMTLRPEGTASVMRSIITNNLANLGKVHKLFYIGPMFRYERPQSGRFRQFHQFGMEVVGLSSYEADVEIIDLSCEIYKRLGLKNISVNISSLGDLNDRDNFKKSLKNYLQDFKSKLSKDSQERLDKNPLRILDSKDPGDIEIVKNAPSILEFLSKDAKEHFENVLKLLKNIGIKFKINDKMVRGLDYYNRTVFEIISDKLGAQNAIGGGGRFDTLLKSFNGPDLPGMGFASGMERLLQVMEAENAFFPKDDFTFAYFIPLNENAKDLCFSYASKLRHLSIPTNMEMNTMKIQNALKNANKQSSKFCIIVGEDEIERKIFQIKDMHEHKQFEISFDKLDEFFKQKYLEMADK